MAVLRDALAEFAAKFCLSIPGVRKFSRLITKLREMSLTDPLATALLSAGNQASTGWVWLFTQYRNFFTHIAPMQEAAQAAYTIQDIRQLEARLRVPQIYCPLPHNIHQLSEKHSQAIPLSSLEELAKECFRPRRRAAEPDALEHLHGCLDRYAELAELLIARSPVAPVPRTLSAEDFIGLKVGIGPAVS